MVRTWLDLTDAFPVRFDLARMRAELTELEGTRWLEHYDPTLTRGWVAIPLRSVDGRMDTPEAQRQGEGLAQFKRTPVVDRLPYFRSLMDDIQAPQGRVRILKLMPGAKIDAHRDVRNEVANIAFKKVRLHVPIYTNPQVQFDVGGVKVPMQEGRLYYANFSKRHWVHNGGTEPRIHLVIDLDVNDWLAKAFPKPTVGERIQFALDRTALPVFWRLRAFRFDLTRRFWRSYTGSRMQRLVHRIKGKTPTAEVAGSKAPPAARGGPPTDAMNGSM